jgi:hypothetical protein
VTPHQLNGLASFIDTLNAADRSGIRLASYYGVRVVVDDQETGLYLGRANGEYIVMPAEDSL